VTQAFLPLLTRSKGGIVNNVSMMVLACQRPWLRAGAAVRPKALERQHAALAELYAALA
jgi:hypothetical protein